MEITDADRQHLAAASEVMLRPFEHASPVDYLVSIAREIAPLVGAFAAMSGTRDPDGVVGLASAEWSDAERAEFAKWKLRDEGTNRAVHLNSDVVTMRELVGDDWDGYNNDPMVNEWYRPHGIGDVIAYFAYWPEDDAVASVEFHGTEFGLPRFGPEGRFLLSLLQPSFRAGMRLLYTVGQLRQTVASDMDEIGVPICVCGRDGRIHHISSKVRSMLAAEPEREAILDSIRGVAGQVLARRSAASRRSGAHAVHEVVRTASRRYRLSAALATHSMHFGRTDVLVAVAELGGDAEAADLATASGFSPRERQVATLIGRGLSNAAIARVLDLSPHTVKRHTERVLAKSGLPTRTALASQMARS
jgi:DNA-binding NarL/FixJ family response regulator